MPSFVLLTAALVMTFPTAPGHAAGQDPLIPTGPADIQALSPHLEYTTDPDWQLKVEDFLGPSASEMRPSPGLKPDFGYTEARIRLRLQLVNGPRRWTTGGAMRA